MKKKHRSKYLIAIYTIVATVAIILWLIAYYSTNLTVQATMLNLSTELLGVVVIFFIVNYFFSLDELDTSEKIDKLLEKLDDEGLPRAQDFFVKKPMIETLIQEASSIDLCGVALATTIDSNLSAIKKALRQGTPIRVLIMEKSEEALKIAANRSEVNDRKYYENKLTATLHNLEVLYDNALLLDSKAATLTVGFVSFPPSFSLKLFHKDDAKGQCIVEIFAHHVGWGEPPIFVVEEAVDPEWFAYFQQQFDAMWEYSRKIEYSNK